MFTGSQDIFFQLEDSEVNEVIFIGEKDIVMACVVTSLLPANIKIEHNKKIVTYNNGTGNCVKYIIKEVKENDGGNYTCTAVYDSISGGQIIQNTTLHLNVHKSTSPQCFRNGTIRKRYEERDVLMMSCYCLQETNQSCRWAQSFLDSNKAEAIPPYEILKTRNKPEKRILRILVGPITAMDQKTRFDCFFGSSAYERCSIGATEDSLNDNVLNTVGYSPHFLTHCLSGDCCTAFPTTVLPYISSTASLLFVDSASNSFAIYYVVGIITFLVCSLAFGVLLICKKKSRNGRKSSQKSVSVKTDNPEMIYNTAYAVSGSELYTGVLKSTNVTGYDIPVATLASDEGIFQDAYETETGYPHSEMDLNSAYAEVPKGKMTARNVAVNDDSAPYAEVNAKRNTPNNPSELIINPAQFSRREPKMNNNFSELYAKIDKNKAK